jgi:hypothetical protein
MPIPLLYRKLIDLCRQDANLKNEASRTEVTANTAARYRLKQQDVKAALEELEGMRALQRKNRLTLRLP